MAETKIVPHPLGIEVGYSVRFKVLPGFWKWVSTTTITKMECIQSWPSIGEARAAVDEADMDGIVSDERKDVAWIVLCGLGLVSLCVALIGVPMYLTAGL